MIPVIDVSKFQGVITLADARQIVAQGKRGVFIRCMEALYSTLDPRFEANVAVFGMVGMPVGAYFPLHPDLDPIKQAEAHFAACKGLGFAPGAFAPWCDIELMNGKTPAEVLAATEAWCGRARELWGRKVSLYTYPNFRHDELSNLVGDDSPLADTRLVMAAYQVKPPVVPEPWDVVSYWQQSGGKPEPGVPVYRLPNGEVCDYGYFMGDDQAFSDALDPSKG